MKNNLYKLLFEARFYSKNDFLIFLYRLIEKKEEIIDRVNNQILLNVFNFLNKKDENEITNNEELEEFVKTKNITEILKIYVRNNIYIINESLLIK